MSRPIPPNGYVHEDEAAAKLGIPKRMLAKFRRTGVSPPYYTVSCWRYYRLRDLSTWIKSRRTRSSSVGAEDAVRPS